MRFGTGWGEGRAGGQQILRLKLKCSIWQCQFGCKHAWTLVFTDKFGWLVKIKPRRLLKLFVCVCVGSFIHWENPFDEVNEYMSTCRSLCSKNKILSIAKNCLRPKSAPLKALFVLKIFTFLSWLFSHVEKMAWLERLG